MLPGRREAGVSARRYVNLVTTHEANTDIPVSIDCDLLGILKLRETKSEMYL
jgi:hypothetical protein